MLVPTKYENLHKSTIVLGADIIKFLRKKDYNIEDLYQEVKLFFIKEESKNSIPLNHYYNVLTFLWLTDIIELEDFNVKLKK